MKYRGLVAGSLIGQRANWNKKGAESENFGRKLAGSIRKRFKVQIGANWDKAIIIYGCADTEFLPLKIYEMVPAKYSRRLHIVIIYGFVSVCVVSITICGSVRRLSGCFVRIIRDHDKQ